MAVDEGNTRSYTVQCEPKHQVLRAVSSVDCHQLSLFDFQVFHKPVADPLQVVEKLLVGPLSAFEDKENVVWVVPACMRFDVVCVK